MSIAGSFVIPMLQKNKTEFKYHAIINLDKDKLHVLGSTVHEILHALESTNEIKNGRIEGNSGFNKEDDNDENRLFSECIHTIILENRIFKQLREMGYEITNYSDYKAKMLPEVKTFFAKFETAILDARCEPTLDKLFNIVGKENFSKLVQYQNSSQNVTQEQMLELISDMEEHSRQNMANRIGQLTLPQQKDLIGKEAAKASFENEIEKSQQEAGKEYDE